MAGSMRLLGLDPGLRVTGWGVIRVEGSHLRHIADGVVRVAEGNSLAVRLAALYAGVTEVIATWQPDEAAVEETFVNLNPTTTLRLGMARGVIMLAPASQGLPVAEYAPTQVKKSVVGVGRADKEQVRMMVRTLLPGAEAKADAADALAIAICHAHHAGTRRAISRRRVPS